MPTTKAGDEGRSLVNNPMQQFESVVNLVATQHLQSKALEQLSFPDARISPSPTYVQVLKLMTKTYDLSGREKGPPKISKLDTINKQINKVTSAQEEMLQNNSR